MASSDTKETEQPAGLGLLTLSALVVANMVGAGVFTSSGYSLATLGSPSRVMLAWWLCGLWAIGGAVAYGALARRLPLSGGEYLFLSQLVHPSVGFLAGWISVVAGFTAPIAVAAQGAALYALGDVDSSDWRLNAVAVGLIVLASACHWVGMAIGVGLQNAIVAAKLILLAVIIVWAFLFTSADAWQGAPLAGASVAWWPEDWSSWTVLVGSMSWIALSYTGFNAAIYVAGQAHEARSNVPRAMLWGTVVVTVIYLLLNYVFVYAPAPDLIAGQSNVASIAAVAVGGNALAWMVRVTIVLAMTSSVFAMLLAGPRVYQKMAEDGVMPKLFHADGGSPRWATAAQAALSCVAVFAADLLQLMKYLGLTLSACGALAVLSLWWARRRLPNSPPLRWWETLAMLVYLLITLAILWASRLTHEDEFNAMLVTFGLGVLVYLIWHQYERLYKVDDRERAERPSGSLHAAPSQDWPKCDGFELVEQVGGGWGADIYVARSTQQANEVMLKILPASRPVPNGQDACQHEAQLLRRLQHPNIVRCLDVGIAQGGEHCYLAMPRIMGETLWQLVQREGGLMQSRAVPLLQQIAAALSAVHALGYIHGDLAPNNIMVSNNDALVHSDSHRQSSYGEVASDARITLIDFGLARPVNCAMPDGSAHEGVRGSPAFMSPESCRADSGTPISYASDIYSFGCIAFLMLTGKLPVAGATPIEILWKQIHSSLPSLSSMTTFPVDVHLGTLIDQCLEKSPNERPASMKCVEDGLIR